MKIIEEANSYMLFYYILTKKKKQAPFHAQRLIYIYGTNNNHQASHPTVLKLYIIMTYVSGILYYLSTCINPLLYNIMSHKFREAFKVCVVYENVLLQIIICCCHEIQYLLFMNVRNLRIYFIAFQIFAQNIIIFKTHNEKFLMFINIMFIYLSLIMIQNSLLVRFMQETLAKICGLSTKETGQKRTYRMLSRSQRKYCHASSSKQDSSEYSGIQLIIFLA